MTASETPSRPLWRGVGSAPAIGLQRRLGRIFRRGSGRLVIAPVDDSLLAGPVDGLENIEEKVMQFGSKASCGFGQLEPTDIAPDAVVGYRLASAHLARLFPSAPFVLNVSASTTIGLHVSKVRAGAVEDALAMDAAAVAVHVNFTSRFEGDQIAALADTASVASRHGMPLMGILYPRREVEGRDDNYEEMRRSDRVRWTQLVCHATRVGVELGCSLIKTQYTGCARSFTQVVEAAEGVPVVIAGGKLRDASDFVETIAGSLQAGAAGVSFGRNFFSRRDSAPWIRAASLLIHGGESPREVIAWLSSYQDGK